MEDNFSLNDLNKFLKKETFQCEFISGIKTNIKIEITGTRMFHVVGIPTTHILFTTYILPTSKDSDIFFNYWSETHGKEIDLMISKYSHLRNEPEKVLYNFLKFFGVNTRVYCDKIIILVEPNQINENLITEGKLDSVVRNIVRDIITIFKKGQTGEFGLPEDLNTDKIFYKFPQFKNEFQVFLEIIPDDSIQGFDVDADFYHEDELIYVTITTNSQFDFKLLYNLIGELNEVIAHELTHFKQYESGFKFPKKEPKNPKKYYSQSHELQAQKAGFKRKSKIQKLDYETLIRRWFEENKHKHKMNPQQSEKVIQKILAQK